ncbi:hypothetical protein ACHHV8_33655 [Paenibacillus sp. TAB 01]|uniref:hypothetical protein n=1 Tax=Paenibacillus sp. TAB 01 TaxID=3368988 RepID=UPI0037513B51
MNKADIWQLFEKIVYYYPSFTGEPEKAAAWYGVLEKVPYHQALANLKHYASIASNKYPPHPGALADQPEHREGNYVPNAEETRKMLEEIDRLKMSVGGEIPESARERMRQLAKNRRTV